MARKRSPPKPQLTPAEMDARDREIAEDSARRSRVPPGVRATQEQLDAPLTPEEEEDVQYMMRDLRRQRDPVTGELPSTILLITPSRKPMSPEEAVRRRAKFIEALADILMRSLRRDHPELFGGAPLAPTEPPPPQPAEEAPVKPRKARAKRVTK